MDRLEVLLTLLDKDISEHLKQTILSDICHEASINVEQRICAEHQLYYQSSINIALIPLSGYEYLLNNGSVASVHSVEIDLRNRIAIAEDALKELQEHHKVATKLANEVEEIIGTYSIVSDEYEEIIADYYLKKGT